MVFFADVAFYAKGSEEVAEDVTGMLLADPMVDVHNRNPSVRLLELMVLDVRREVHIRALRYRLRNELRSAAATKSNLGDLKIRRFEDLKIRRLRFGEGVADVGRVQARAYVY